MKFSRNVHLWNFQETIHKYGVISRIDRFLLSEGTIREWKVAGQWVGDRYISDHCPIC